MIGAIKSLYQNSESTVKISGTIVQMFQTMVGVCQGCILLPALFNLYLESLMKEALENFITEVSVGGRSICK